MMEAGLEERIRRLMRKELRGIMEELREIKSWREEVMEMKEEVKEEIKRGMKDRGR